MNAIAMSSLWIKVCGLSDAAGIDAAARAGVQAVGFVFHEPSPRNLSIADAAALQAVVPPGIERIAVFLHPSQALLDAVIARVRPDCVQMDASDLASRMIPSSLPVLPVMRSGSTPTSPTGLPARFLLESALSGAGERADWSEAARLAGRAQVVLAGGLDAGNVGEAILAVRPYGVDVSSGVESSRGVKSPALIRDFVMAARAAQTRLAG